MEVNYQRDMNHNYMILKCEDDLREESYETRMIFANKIPGLLPCHIRYIDGRTYLGYDVTCRQSLTVFCESRKPGRKEIRNILGSILETIKVMEEYLLSPDHLILDPQLVLMKFETQEAVLAFAPFFRKDIRNSLKELTEYLLTFVAHDDQQGIVLGYRISHELTENSAGVAELLDILYEKKCAEKGVGVTAFYENSQRDIGEGPVFDTEPFRESKRAGLPETENDRMSGTVAGSPVHKRIPDNPRAGPDRKEKKETKKQRFAKKAFCIVAIGLLAAAGLFMGLHYLFPAVLNNTGFMVRILAAGLVITAAVGAGIFIRRRDKAGRDRRKEYTSLSEKESGVLYSELSDSEDYDSNPGNELSEDISLSNIRNEFETLTQMQNPDRETGEKYTDKLRVEETDWNAEGKGTEVTALLTGGPQGEATAAFLIPENSQADYPMIPLSDREVLIGKQKELVSCVINSPQVSRVHARIRRGVDGYYLRDLNSTNGTSVNGEMIFGDEEVRLCPGDHIAIADIVYIMK